MHPKPEKREKKKPSPLKRTAIKRKPYSLKRSPIKKKPVRIKKVSTKKSKEINISQALFDKWIKESDGCCAECKLLGVNNPEIPMINGSNVSHYASGGSNPAMYRDPGNKDILCMPHHLQWETGDRDTMMIYEKGKLIIEEMMNKYYQSKKIPKF